MSRGQLGEPGVAGYRAVRVRHKDGGGLGKVYPVALLEKQLPPHER